MKTFAELVLNGERKSSEFMEWINEVGPYFMKNIGFSKIIYSKWVEAIARTGNRNESNKILEDYFNNLKELWQKRMKGVTKSYLPNMETREYKWLDLNNNKLLLFSWIVWATIFIPELVIGITRSIKYKDAACLYQPVASFLVTWSMICGTLKSGVKLNKLRNKI